MKRINKTIVFLFLVYHLLIPVYYIYFGGMDSSDLSKTGPRFNQFGGLTLNTLVLLILIANTFLCHRNKFQFIRKKYKGIINILFLYIGLIILVTTIQFMGMGLSATVSIRKPLGFFSFPFLILNILLFFNERDIRKLLQFIVYSGLFVLSIFCIFVVSNYFIDFQGINYENRLGGLVHYSSNGTAAFLAMLIPLFIYYVNRYYIKNPFFRIVWYVFITFLILLILLTFTRTVMIGGLFSIILYYLIIKKTVTRTIVFLGFIVLFIAFYSTITDLILRGEIDVFETLEEGEENTLSSRIFIYWLPSFSYLISHPEQLLFGTPFRGFNEFLYYISGINRANHNSFVLHLTSFGLFIMITWMLFWYRLLIKTYRTLRGKRIYKMKDDVLNLTTASFFILFIYFVSFNFMNINDEFFTNNIAIIACILTWNLQSLEYSKNQKINLYH